MSTTTHLFPEWYLACHVSGSTHISHSRMHISDHEIHTNPKGPKAVLSSYVNYCMLSALTWLQGECCIIQTGWRE